MSLIKLNQSKARRAQRVRARIHQYDAVPRVSVFRSLKQIYAQLIDDAKSQTLASCSSRELKAKGNKKDVAKAVGMELAKRAREKGVEAVRFDRGSFLYHGRVKALAEGLREGGLKV